MENHCEKCKDLHSPLHFNCRCHQETDEKKFIATQIGDEKPNVTPYNSLEDLGSSTSKGWEEEWERILRPIGESRQLMMVPSRMDYAQFMVLENKEKEVKSFISQLLVKEREDGTNEEREIMNKREAKISELRFEAGRAAAIEKVLAQIKENQSRGYEANTILQGVVAELTIYLLLKKDLSTNSQKK